MALRREQGLLLATIAFAALMWFNRDKPPARIAVQPQVGEYEAAPVPATALLPSNGEARGGARTTLFTEPSESVPLPPRALAEPPADPLPVVWLPLLVHPQAYRLLRGSGDVAQGVALDGGESETPENGESASLPDSAPESSDRGSAAWERIYDRAVMQTGEVYWGEILEENKVALARSAPTGKVRFRWIEPESGRAKGEIPLDAANIKELHLAKTLRNEAALRMLDVTNEVANLDVRASVIEWLLRQGTKEGWAYAEAEKLARGYAAISLDKVDGYRMVARVLRAAGRVGDEWRLYHSLPAEIQDTPFRWTGQGEIEALLGLDAAAEEHLRKATATGNDPRAAVALTRFLLSRGRTEEAVAAARRAYRDRNALTRADEQLALKRALVSAYLAAGLVEDARAVAGTLPASATALRGAIAYVTGDVESAASQFRAAQEHDDLPGLAALGAAACAARAGRWAEALAGFQALADRDPLQRARALGGAALVHERTGNFEQAAALLEEALAADPTDPWLAYLRGRALREAGDLDGAVEQLDQALRRSDHLVEAMAELAETHLRIAERDRGRAIESLERAVRYADRCVELDAQFAGKPAPRFLELQGLVRWRAGDLRGARQAFAAARDAGSVYGQVGLALIDYAQGRTDAAREQLSELERRPPGDAFREYGRQTVAAIDDHAEKVEIRDDFERDDVGDRWSHEADSRTPLRPAIDRKSGRLVFRGRTDGQDGALRRRVEHAGDFVAAEVTIERGAADQSSFAGMRLLVGRETRAPELQVRLGFDRGQPILQIQDGENRATTAEEQAKFEPRPLDVGATTGPQRLRLEFVPDGDGFVLLAAWNDRVVGEEKITRVRRASRQLALNVDLQVKGARGEVDVAFDEFRLRQRQTSR